MKHVRVVAFLAVAVLSERAFLGQISDQKPEALNTNMVLGVVILLLTSLAAAG